MAKDEIYKGTMCTVCQHGPLLIKKYKGKRYAYCTEGGPLGPKQRHTMKLMDPVEELAEILADEEIPGLEEFEVEKVEEELEEEKEGGINE